MNIQEKFFGSFVYRIQLECINISIPMPSNFWLLDDRPRSECYTALRDTIASNLNATHVQRASA